MKKYSGRKWAVLLLSAAMILSCAGCAKTSQPEAAQEQTEISAAAEDGAAKEGEDGLADTVRDEDASAQNADETAEAESEEETAKDVPEETAESDPDQEEEAETEEISENPEQEDEPEETEEPYEPYVLPEGMYFSEMTGEPISTDIQDQRPVAFMIDNDERANPHYGTSQADVVYELINSMANNRITRFMVLVKDWEKIEKMGNIRSVRPTNILLNAEWNGILCHDGGPFYINAYLNKGYTDHFSGTFSRVNNGKAREFTEYCLTGDLDRNFKNYPGVSRNYNSNKPEEDYHFNFAEYGTRVTLEEDHSYPASQVILPHWHNKPKLVFNEETGKYDYYQYGALYKDAGNGETMSFDNIIIQKCEIHQYDSNGYMIYNCIGMQQEGFYVTNGRFMPIIWQKIGDTGITRYFDFDGNEIQLNTGKTYITLIPPDVWLDVTIG